MWSGNVQGLYSRNTDKFELIIGQMREAHCQVGIIIETHMTAHQSARLIPRARAMGLGTCISSPGAARRLGVTIVGPTAMKKDPYKWPADLDGRVASAVLPTREGSSILVIGVCGDVDSFANRASMCEEIAKRVYLSDLPAYMAGDWNCQPGDPELVHLHRAWYAHVELGLPAFATHEHRCIDFGLTSRAVATDFMTTPRIGDHDNVICALKVDTDVVAECVTKYPRLNPPPDTEDWSNKFSDAMADRQERWNIATDNNDVDEMWTIWCEAMETSCGIDADKQHRAEGTTLTRRQRVFRGPDARRQTVRERQLHRVLRRIHHFVRGTAHDHDYENLARHIDRSVKSMIDKGHLGDDTDDLYIDGMADLVRVAERIQHQLNHIAITNKNDRLDEWAHRQSSNHLSGIFKYTRDGTDAAGLAANDSCGRVSADPRAVMQDALQAWNKKQLPHLEPEDYRQYVDEVRPFLEHVQPPPPWQYTVDSLRRALKDTANSAMGPGQWDAGVLAKAPDVALGFLAQIGDMIKRARRWPRALKAQEVSMIPKPHGKSSLDLRPIGVAPSVARALSRVAVRMYKAWGRCVQVTDVYSTLLDVDACVTRATTDQSNMYFRRSDLNNCFGHIQPELVMELSRILGMPDDDSWLLFGNHIQRDTVVKSTGYSSDSFVVERGLAQGDPASLLGAAILAGCHARRIKASVDVQFHTYVDDRTTIADTIDKIKDAETLTKHLDHLSGQAEDPSKEEKASIGNGPDKYEYGNQFLDLLGVRVDLTGAHPATAAPRAIARTQKFITKSNRLRRVACAARLPGDSRLRVLAGLAGSLRWDGAWGELSKKDCSRVRFAIEMAMSGQSRTRTWRHRGAALVLQNRMWTTDPSGIRLNATITMMRALARTAPRDVVDEMWANADPKGPRFLDQARGIYDDFRWDAPTSPFEVRFGGENFNLQICRKDILDHHVREAWRSQVLRSLAVTIRKEHVYVPSIELKLLRNFIDAGTDTKDRMRRWRCCVGAEPSADRLSHVALDIVNHDCSVCGVADTTRHALWECPTTAQIRADFGLDVSTVGANLPDAEKAALQLNGWVRAWWDTYPGIDVIAHARTFVINCRLARKILDMKLAVFDCNFHILEGHRRLQN